MAAQLGKPLPRLASLWVGSRLNWVSRLTILSAQALGHPFTLYVYPGFWGAPPGVDVRDAGPILPLREVKAHRSNGSFALPSNLFRYRLLQREAVTWVDLDVVVLKPLDFSV
jgi:hypothetical protein